MGNKIASGVDIDQRTCNYLFVALDVGGTFVSDK